MKGEVDTEQAVAQKMTMGASQDMEPEEEDAEEQTMQQLIESFFIRDSEMIVPSHDLTDFELEA